MGNGFYSGGTSEGFYDGVTPPGGYVDIAVAVVVAAPDVSLTVVVTEATYVDTAVHIVVPAAPLVAIAEVVVAAPTRPPAPPPAYATGLDVILWRDGVFAKHIGAHVANLHTSRARKYGFEACSFELPEAKVTSWYVELQPMTDIVVFRDGVTIFEGRVTDPGLSIGSDDHRRTVSCRGYADALADDGCARVLFADSDPSAWKRPTATPIHDFAISATTSDDATGDIVAQAQWGSTYAADAWGDICYKLYGGLATPDKISGVSIGWHWNGILDPKRLIFGRTPRYNLYPDPRALSGSSAWQFQNPDAGAAAEGKPPRACAVDWQTIHPAANGLLWNADAWGNLPSYAYAVYVCSMKLPADVQKDVAAGGQWFAFTGLSMGTNATDTLALLAKDSDGNGIASAQVTLPGAPTMESLEDVTCYLPAPPGTAELVLVVTTYAGNTASRYLVLPMVTNYDGGFFYHDGFMDGWEWTGGANNSPSRETTTTVAEAILEELAGGGEFGSCPLVAQLFASDKPGTVTYQLPSNENVLTWQNYTAKLGFRSLVDYTRSARWPANGCRGLGLSIFLNPDSPYSLGFPTPPDGDTPASYGLDVFDVCVFGAAGCGDKNGIGVLDCLKYIVGRYLPPEQMDFPDASTLKARQLVYNDATTWLDIYGQVEALLDWEYGFREGGTWYAYKTSRLHDDPRHVYQIPYSKTLADNLQRQLADIYNGCEVSWTDENGDPHARMVTQASPALPTRPDGTQPQRYYALSAPSGSTKNDATTLAKAFLEDHSRPQVTGSLPLTAPEVIDGNGTPHKTISLMEGEFVRLTDAPPEEQLDGLLQIAYVSIDNDTLQVTLQVSMNRRRMDSLLARFNAKARTR